MKVEQEVKLFASNQAADKLASSRFAITEKMTFKNTQVSSDDSTINFGSMGTELKVAISLCVV